MALLPRKGSTLWLLSDRHHISSSEPETTGAPPESLKWLVNGSNQLSEWLFEFPVGSRPEPVESWPVHDYSDDDPKGLGTSEIDFGIGQRIVVIREGGAPGMTRHVAKVLNPVVPPPVPQREPDVPSPRFCLTTLTTQPVVEELDVGLLTHTLLPLPAAFWWLCRTANDYGGPAPELVLGQLVYHFQSAMIISKQDEQVYMNDDEVRQMTRMQGLLEMAAAVAADLSLQVLDSYRHQGSESDQNRQLGVLLKDYGYTLDQIQALDNPSARKH